MMVPKFIIAATKGAVRITTQHTVERNKALTKDVRLLVLPVKHLAGKRTTLGPGLDFQENCRAGGFLSWS